MSSPPDSNPSGPSPLRPRWLRVTLGAGLLLGLVVVGLEVYRRASRMIEGVGKTGVHVSAFRDREILHDESVRIPGGPWIRPPAPGASWVDERDCWGDGEGRYWTFPDQREVDASGCPVDIAPPPETRVPEDAD